MSWHDRHQRAPRPVKPLVQFAAGIHGLTVDAAATVRALAAFAAEQLGYGPRQDDEHHGSTANGQRRR